MAVGKEDRGSLWADGQFTVKVRGPGLEPARTFRVRRPFALIGQIPGADLRIDDPTVDGRHAFLILDHRGLFGVDLLSRSGTKFAGASAACAWLGPGDVFEIAGRRIEILQLRVDGSIIDPPLSNDDPFAAIDDPLYPSLAIEPLDSPGSPWVLGSSLAFVGRGDACAIRIDNASASMTHCALLRTPTDAYVIDLLGRQTLVNDRAVAGASRLLDGDLMTIGQARFLVHIKNAESREVSTPLLTSTELALTLREPGETLVARIIHQADPSIDVSSGQIIEILRQFQADAATLLEAQMERIDTLNREIASLRSEVRDARGPVAPSSPPLRLDLTPPPLATTDASATWLLDRLNTLETESRSTWKDLLGRIGSSVIPRGQPEPGQSLAPTRPGTPRSDES